MTPAVAFASEPDLLTAAASGNAGAVRRLLDDAGPVVYGFVLARVAGDRARAEDLVQETFLQAVRSAASFRGDAALSTWLCGIARHLVARHYADERRQERVRSGLVAIDGGLSAHGEDPAASLDAVEHRQHVLAALGRLPALHRQVLVLKYLDGLTVEEIASEVGRSRVQVQSLLQRARDGLRRELGDDDV